MLVCFPKFEYTIQEGNCKGNRTETTFEATCPEAYPIIRNGCGVLAFTLGINRRISLCTTTAVETLPHKNQTHHQMVSATLSSLETSLETRKLLSRLHLTSLGGNQQENWCFSNNQHLDDKLSKRAKRYEADLFQVLLESRWSVGRCGLYLFQYQSSTICYLVPYLASNTSHSHPLSSVSTSVPQISKPAIYIKVVVL